MATRFTARSRSCRSTVRIAGATFAGLLLAAALAAAEPPGVRRAARREAVRHGPKVEGRVLRQLHLGMLKARQKIQGLRSCQELFDRLGADGVDMLADTTYVLARSDWERRVCANASAFTTVGGSMVWICGGFGRLSDEEAAEILLHEALHGAGLGEQPLDPDGPTAEEIDELVRNKCGF